MGSDGVVVMVLVVGCRGCLGVQQSLGRESGREKAW